MNPKVQALADELTLLRNKLMVTPSSTPGFREMRRLMNRLTDELIDAGDKADEEIARRIHDVAAEVAAEWKRNNAQLGNWSQILKTVVGAVGAVTMLAGIPNPLAGLLLAA